MSSIPSSEVPAREEDVVDDLTGSLEPVDQEITRRPDYPQYSGDTETVETSSYLKLQNNRRILDGWVDKVYFLFAGVASIWLAVTALIESLTHSWWAIPLVLIIWAIFAYMTLPRFHRIMTSLYVPDYFIGRTQTSDGLLGDPVNLALQGEAVDVHTAMRRAGWHQAEEVTLASSWRIIVNTVRRRPYPTAPVSPLFLFGRKEDFAYQQEVDDSPSKRHHVRFWKTPAGWKLPGGEEVDWLAGATFDRAVGLSLFTFQVTHKIDADTDRERDYVIETVRYANSEADTRIIEDFSTGYHSRNGGGDDIVTDGNLPILQLDDVVPERQEVSDEDPESKYSHHRSPWQLAEQTPLSVWLAGAFVSIVALLQLGWGLVRVLSPDFRRELEQDDTLGLATEFTADTGHEILTMALAVTSAALIIMSLVQVFFAVGVIRGRQRSRKISLALLCIGFVMTAVQVWYGTAGNGNVYAVFVLMASHVFAMLEFTSDGAVNYTYNATRARRRKRRARREESTEARG